MTSSESLASFVLNSTVIRKSQGQSPFIFRMVFFVRSRCNNSAEGIYAGRRSPPRPVAVRDAVNTGALALQCLYKPSYCTILSCRVLDRRTLATMSLTPEQVKIIIATVPVLQHHGKDITTRFYDEMLARSQKCFQPHKSDQRTTSCRPCWEPLCLRGPQRRPWSIGSRTGKDQSETRLTVRRAEPIRRSGKVSS